MFEIDYRAAEENVEGEDSTYFYVKNLKRPINIKDPNIDSGDYQYTLLKDYVAFADSILFDNGGKSASEWFDLFDIESFAEWFVIVELCKDADLCRFFSSCYFHIDSFDYGNSIKMGPLWDCDRSFAGYPAQDHPYNDVKGLESLTMRHGTKGF